MSEHGRYVEKLWRDLAGRLRVHRETTGMTMDGQARRAGVSQATVKRLYSGGPPSLLSLIGLLKFLDSEGELR